MDEQLKERLCTVPLFADLEHDHLASLAGLVQPFEAEAGLVLIQPGMVGAGLFLIEEGTAVLGLRDGDVQLGPGELIGELALLDDRHIHTARVKTTSVVRGICISRDDFETLLHAEPRIAIPMLKVLAKRLVDVILHH